jgi:hypothetical protein
MCIRQPERKGKRTHGGKFIFKRKKKKRKELRQDMK